jgi:hypothetical protein
VNVPRLLGVVLIAVAAAACSSGPASTLAPGAGGTQDALVRGAFGVCTDGVHVGQSAPVAGITCSDVCSVLGFSGCEYRAGQSGLEACTPVSPERSGACTDVFKDNWSSQCLCTR